ncbi:hypothetical protein TH53_01580 [Pedobacter lusitanus]|uniref:Uncharacterized protein n=2 Tax=Pedobacter lusitanus TaxID=1503925 RepID=A0A0D0GRI2_9SPHI|nr:hypothetical protein TH53_01580 [Pedobacter lusitanus]
MNKKNKRGIIYSQYNNMKEIKTEKQAKQNEMKLSKLVSTNVISASENEIPQVLTDDKTKIQTTENQIV